MKVSGKPKPCIYFPSIRSAFRSALLVLPRTLPSNFFKNLGLQISSLLDFLAEGFTCVSRRSRPARSVVGPGRAPLEGPGGRARPGARGPSRPTGGGDSAGRESSSFPRLPPRLPPDLPPALPGFPRPEHGCETGRAGKSRPLCAPHPGPPLPGTAKAGRPSPGDGHSRRLPFHPTLHLLAAFVWERGWRGGAAVPACGGAGVAPVRPRARPPGDSGLADVSALPLSGGRPGAAPLSPSFSARGSRCGAAALWGGASGCPVGETRVSPSFRGEGEAEAPLPAALLPAPRVARWHLPRRQVATSWYHPPPPGSGLGARQYRGLRGRRRRGRAEQPSLAADGAGPAGAAGRVGGSAGGRRLARTGERPAEASQPRRRRALHGGLGAAGRAGAAGRRRPSARRRAGGTGARDGDGGAASN